MMIILSFGIKCLTLCLILKYFTGTISRNQSFKVNENITSFKTAIFRIKKRTQIVCKMKENFLSCRPENKDKNIYFLMLIKTRRMNLNFKWIDQF